MALYSVAAIAMIGFALLGPSNLFVFGRPMVPSHLPIVIGGLVVGGTWTSLNLIALVRLLRHPPRDRVSARVAEL